MKKKIKIGIAVLLFALQATASMAAGENPSCVLMKFTDDTRFDRIESGATLSDLVMEKLLNSGIFNFKETKVIDQNMEDSLYDEKKAFFQSSRQAMNYGDYDALFEGQGYRDK